MTRHEVIEEMNQVIHELARLRYQQNALDISETSLANHDEYDTMLNECYEEVNVCGYKYDPAQALKGLDPIAYNCGFVDWLDSLDIEESNEWKEFQEKIGELEYRHSILDDYLSELEDAE